jgi:NADPH2:quinone reductase
MHAIEIVEPGGPEVLTYVDKPRPSPGPCEVLIKAEASGVNFVDTYFRSGLYPHELPFVLGAEVAGTVAAAALLKGMTAHFLIKSVYRVRHGDTVPLHAGADGVGLILTQWATSLGARVITTASTAHKAQLSRTAGAIEVLDYPDDPQQFGAKIRDLTGGDGVAAVYDGVRKSTFDASLASLAVRGTLALFGAASGPVPPVDPQRLNAAGSVYLSRPSRIHFRAGRPLARWC